MLCFDTIMFSDVSQVKVFRLSVTRNLFMSFTQAVLKLYDTLPAAKLFNRYHHIFMLQRMVF